MSMCGALIYVMLLYAEMVGWNFCYCIEDRMGEKQFVYGIDYCLYWIHELE